MPLLTFQSNSEKIDLNYSITGSGPHKIVLIAGANSSGVVWQYLIPHLSEFTILTFDYRGCGYSSCPTQFSLDAFAEDIIQLVDHLKWDTFNICGLSMGGCVCLKLIQKYPHRIKSQILLSTALRGSGIVTWKAVGLIILQNILSLFKYSARAYAVAPMLYPYSYLSTKRPDGELMYFHAVRTLRKDIFSIPPPSFACIKGHIQATKSFELSEADINTIKCLNIPSIVLSGDKDIVCPTFYTQQLANRLHYPLHILRNVGHAPVSQGDVPKQVAKLITELISQ